MENWDRALPTTVPWASPRDSDQDGEHRTLGWESGELHLSPGSAAVCTTFGHPLNSLSLGFLTFNGSYNIHSTTLSSGAKL